MHGTVNIKLLENYFNVSTTWQLPCFRFGLNSLNVYFIYVLCNEYVIVCLDFAF